jgi:hypothetical protein
MKTKTRAFLILNPNRETRKVKTRTQQMHNKNSIKFYYKNEIKPKEGCNKKRY